MEEYTRKCENCIWFDQCHEGEVCDNYEPISLEEQEVLDIKAYEEDLHIRHELYMKQVEEQDK